MLARLVDGAGFQLRRPDEMLHPHLGSDVLLTRVIPGQHLQADRALQPLWCRSNKPRPLVSTPRDSRHSPALPAIRRLADGLLYHCTSPPQHNRPLPATQPFCEPPCVFQRDEVAESSPGRGRGRAAFEGVRTAPISRHTEVAHDPTDEIFGTTRYARASWPLGPCTPGLVPPGHHRLGAAPGWRKARSLSRSPRPPTAITSTSGHCCSTPSICAGIPGATARTARAGRADGLPAAVQRSGPLAHQPRGAAVRGPDSPGGAVSVGARPYGQRVRTARGGVADRLRQPGDGPGVVHRMPTPLASRFVHLDIRVDPEDRLDWGAANGIVPEVPLFIT